MAVSKHFSDDELKCKCCGVNKVKPRLLSYLEKLRKTYGKPIKVTSGYRCPNHNFEVGGTLKSAHMDGEAVDIFIPDSVERYKLLWSILGQDNFTGVGIGKTFIHLDIKKRFNKVVFTY